MESPEWNGVPRMEWSPPQLPPDQVSARAKQPSPGRKQRKVSQNAKKKCKKTCFGQISAPAARPERRLWQIEALGKSLHLPAPGNQGSQRKKHRKVTQNAQKTAPNLFWSVVSASGSPWAKTLANGSSGLQLSFAKVSSRGEPLAPRSEQKRQKTQKNDSS